MLVLVGTIPIRDLPLIVGQAELTPDGLSINGQPLDINRGTAAMISAACAFCQGCGLQRPLCVIAGDIGARNGSIKIYEYLANNLTKMETKVKVLAFHYIMPDIKRNKRVLEKIGRMKERPILIADAGSMYAAKAGGDAACYDVFTPDVGELAFLADEKAVHPSYTRGFIFHLENDVPELIRRAFKSKNAARTLFVKGRVDYICQHGEILERIVDPNIEELEPIGGTGDTITGMISALVYKGESTVKACLIAGRANRRAGELSHPDPATQVKDIIKHVPRALEDLLENDPVGKTSYG